MRLGGRVGRSRMGRGRCARAVRRGVRCAERARGAACRRSVRPIAHDSEGWGRDVSLDPHPSDAEILRRKAEKEARTAKPAIVPGPNSLVHLATRTDSATPSKARKRAEQREHSEQALLF